MKNPALLLTQIMRTHTRRVGGCKWTRNKSPCNTRQYCPWACKITHALQYPCIIPAPAKKVLKYSKSNSENPLFLMFLIGTSCARLGAKIPFFRQICSSMWMAFCAIDDQKRKIQVHRTCMLNNTRNINFDQVPFVGLQLVKKEGAGGVFPLASLDKIYSTPSILQGWNLFQQSV